MKLVDFFRKFVVEKEVMKTETLTVLVDGGMMVRVTGWDHTSVDDLVRDVSF